MLDTVKLISPYLSEADAERIEAACVLRSAVQVSTGEVLYSLTTGSLDGSFDTRVSVRVEREEWQYLPPTDKKQSRGVSMRVPCAPYMTIEGSVHKAMLGHNVWGGPLNPEAACRWFVQDVSGRLGLALPVGDEWSVQRADWAEVFELPNFEACQEYVSGLNMAQFPRRNVIRHGSESLFAPGRTTTVKVYHKGPEFFAHDRRRLRDVVSDSDLVGLQEHANCILRFETEVKARKLAEDFQGKKPLVVQVTQSYLEDVHDREAARLLREAKHEMDTVRRYREVDRRLHEVYDDRLANILLGVWVRLAAVGEAEVRKQVPRRTWYHQKKQLVDAGVSWQASDVQIVPSQSALPADFSPTRRSPYRMTGESPDVARMLSPFIK